MGAATDAPPLIPSPPDGQTAEFFRPDSGSPGEAERQRARAACPGRKATRKQLCMFFPMRQPNLLA